MASGSERETEEWDRDGERRSRKPERRAAPPLFLFFFFVVGPTRGAHNLPGVALFRFLQVEVTVLEVLLLALLLLTFDP